MHFVYCLATLDALLYIGVDSEVPTMVIPIDNAEYLVLASLMTILVELSFVSHMS